VSFPRVDSHQHFTREYLPPLLLPILKRNRFNGTVLVNGPSCQEDNRWLLSLAGENDFILGVVCRAESNLSAVLDEYQRHPKFRGVAAAELHPDALAELARRDLTLDLPPRFDIVPSIAEAFPELRIAIDHVGRASLMQSERPEQFAALARYPNVFVKISGLITDTPTQWKPAQFAPWVHAALAAFGAERVMYGSDWPSYLPEGTWKEALAAFTQAVGAQTIETREQLLGATARRFYRLGDDA
jgi:L-fuconolactonase